jgi:flagellar biosynthetic protein FliP
VSTASTTTGRRVRLGLLALALAGAWLVLGAGSAGASVPPSAVVATGTTSVVTASGTTSLAAGSGTTGARPAAVTAPTSPATPTPPATPAPGDVTVSINGVNGTPSSSIVVLLAVTLLSVAPAVLIMTTSFTKIFVVLSLTRNALGLQSVPPNQVLAGLALFLSLFVMAPVLTDVKNDAVQPYLDGHVTFSQAVDAGKAPLESFMLQHTREQDIALITRAGDRANPATPADTPFVTLVPAFVLSELRSAFVMGFVIFVPFLVVDIVVSSSLMAMGMMMLPPVMVSLPFKILLFVLVDGWGLVITSLIGSYTGAG